MPMNDTLAAALSNILNAERISKKEVVIYPASKTIKKILQVMKENGYIGELKEIKDSKGLRFEVALLGKINNCNAIKPRFSVTLKNYEKAEKRYLPAKDFGILFIGTTKGIMTQIKAKEKKQGGRLLAYCY